MCTGKYWISNENLDSELPKTIAEKIKSDIYTYKAQSQIAQIKRNYKTQQKEKPLRKTNCHVPMEVRNCIGKDYHEIERILREAGFCSFLIVSREKPKGFFDKRKNLKSGEVYSLSINGTVDFIKDNYQYNVPITITYIE